MHVASSAPKHVCECSWLLQDDARVVGQWLEVKKLPLQWRT